MDESWREKLIEDAAGAERLLLEARRVAVIGIKTEASSFQPAYYVAEYLKNAGVEVVPVPVYYPEATEILGAPVYRTLADVPGRVDMVILFRRSGDVAKHVEEILAHHPDSVWMQLGIRDAAAAERFARAGITVVQDRCAMIDHRRGLQRQQQQQR